ncbi:MAG: chlororespiratory reduction protein 7 [Cyanobium sp.]
MSDPLIREMDHYVVLEPGGEEAILSAEDTRLWLARHLSSLTTTPADLVHLSSVEAQVERLLETACELDLAPGVTIQWFAVRLDRPG